MATRKRELCSLSKAVSSHRTPNLCALCVLCVLFTLAGCSRRDAVPETPESNESLRLSVYGEPEALVTSPQPFPFQLEDAHLNYTKFFSINGEMWVIAAGDPDKLKVLRDGQWETKHEFERSCISHVVDNENRLWLAFTRARLNSEEKITFRIARYDTREERLDFLHDLPFIGEPRGDPLKPELRKDPQGRIWLLGHIYGVYRFDEDGTCRLVVNFDEEFEGKNDCAWAREILFDADGCATLLCSTKRHWVPSDTSRAVSLDGEQNPSLFQIPDLPEGDYHTAALLTIDGSQELWFSIEKKGLWRAPVAGGAAFRQEFPEDLTKNPIQQIFSAGGTVWVVRGGFSTDGRRIHNEHSELWRWDSGGNFGGSGSDWRKVIGDLEKWHWSYSHPYLATEKGLWFGTNANGIWFVPHSPLGRSPSIKSVGQRPTNAPQNHKPCKGDINEALISPLQGFDDFSSSEGRCPSLLMKGLRPNGKFWFSSNNELLAFNPSSPSTAVGRFDWRDGFPCSKIYAIHPLPDGRLLALGGSSYCTFHPDEALDSTPKKPASDIVHVSRDQYQFETFKREDGEIFTKEKNAITAYRWDGEGWVKAPSGEKTGEKLPSYQQNWAGLKLPQEWYIYRGRGTRYPLKNDNGDGWMYAKGMLWRVKDGQMAPYFAEGEPHPFTRHPLTYSAVTEDKFGNYLFIGPNDIVRVPIRQASSPLTLTLEQLADDSVRIHIAGTNDKPVRVRLGKQPWSWWAKNDYAEFKDLPPGDYRFEVETLSEHLEPSTQQIEFTIKAVEPAKAEADVSATSSSSDSSDVHVAPEPPVPSTPSIPTIPISEATEKLFSANWTERNEAVKTLIQFPDQARELLKKIDPTQLSETDRWWLDTAMQKVEEAK